MVLLRSTEIRERKDGYQKAASVFDEKLDELSDRFIKELAIIENNIKKKENLIKRLEAIINEIDKKNQTDEKRKEYDMLIKCKNVMEGDIRYYEIMKKKQTSLIADINSMRGMFSTAVKGIDLFRNFK